MDVFEFMTVVVKGVCFIAALCAMFNGTNSNWNRFMEMIERRNAQNNDAKVKLEGIKLKELGAGSTAP